MKIVLGVLASLIAMTATFLIVGFGVSYALIIMHFAGSESVVELCFEIGFGVGLLCSLLVGFLSFRFLWNRYLSSASE
ncbi:MAG: hypothetical protein KGN79_11560 [Acidobacteriota bacterium]|nr:hypothetical protein [Acidobacteriota bacterium]